MAQRFQLGAQRGEVVDLAVVGHHIATVGRGHRLVAQRGQVENAQAAVRQRDAGPGIDPAATIIRPAVVQCLAHGQHLRLQHLGRRHRRRQQHSRQSTHASGFLRQFKGGANHCIVAWKPEHCCPRQRGIGIGTADPAQRQVAEAGLDQRGDHALAHPAAVPPLVQHQHPPGTGGLCCDEGGIQWHQPARGARPRGLPSTIPQPLP
ncbi:hypothetical protein G6F31_016351 [Rhizopus arrhizus]|nr:hypothetical protein G6F31_016351 [Rhizopus arrhizus]